MKLSENGFGSMYSLVFSVPDLIAGSLESSRLVFIGRLANSTPCKTHRIMLIQKTCGSDGVHLTKAGYELMGDTVADRLIGIVKPPGTLKPLYDEMESGLILGLDRESKM